MMAKPRVFVSSTFYDLRQVRLDLEVFIRGLGYEPVLNEQGSIPYGKESRIEEYCYKEISNIDLFVSIIGGRFGSKSQHQNLSVSQMEFKTAFKLNKQVYIFIEKNLSAEYQTYLLNRQNKDIKYRFADDIRIYEFIESCENLPNNNNICAFETSKDIICYLKEQWAGLFQQFLRNQSRNKNENSIQMTENEGKGLRQYCAMVSQEPESAVPLIRNTMLSEHPAVREIKKLFNINYRFYFITDVELTEWLATRKFCRADYLNGGDEMVYYRINRRQMKKQLLTVKRKIFTLDGELKVCGLSDWKSDLVQLTEEPLVESEPKDLPF